MKRTLIERLKRRPVWIAVGVALLVVAASLLAVALLSPRFAFPDRASTASLNETPVGVPPTTASSSTTPGSDSATPPPDTATPALGSTTERLAASVNGYTITRSYMSQTVRLNQVLGQLSGASTLSEEETLERLIRSELILQGVEGIQEPTPEDVEGFIASLEGSWGVSDGTVVERLQAVGVDRAFLEDTIQKLLTVEAGVQILESDGESIAEWLIEQEQDAEIIVFDDEATEEEGEASPTAQPTPEAAVPDVAPDFTLSRAGGGSFALKEQLEEGPLVLVFFEKCG
jgi:hypothetical protein